MAGRSSSRMVQKSWNLPGVTRLGIFQPPSRIRLPATLSREVKPFYVRLQELENRQGRAQKNPWHHELAKERLFKFPLDNERERVKTLEKTATFADHIHFDEQLQWVPATGPIAAFMDIVVLGLSKNHTRTVKEKRKIIQRFRNHFANFLDDDHLFPLEDLERIKPHFPTEISEKKLLSSFIEEPVYEVGIGRVAKPFKKFKKARTR